MHICIVWLQTVDVNWKWSVRILFSCSINKEANQTKEVVTAGEGVLAAFAAQQERTISALECLYKLSAR
jgi:hypothetical protein